MIARSMTAPSFVAFVGIDWADQVHAVCELSQDGTHWRAAEVPQSPEAIASWLQQLRASCGQGIIAIGLESSRGGLVAALLQHKDLVLFPVNPKQLSRYRDAMFPSGAKNDPGDAKLLAEFVRDHHLRLRPGILTMQQLERSRCAVNCEGSSSTRRNALFSG